MVINPKIKILRRGKLSRINEINLVKIKTGAKFLWRKALFTFSPLSFEELSLIVPEHH